MAVIWATVKLKKTFDFSVSLGWKDISSSAISQFIPNIMIEPCQLADGSTLGTCLALMHSMIRDQVRDMEHPTSPHLNRIYMKS